MSTDRITRLRALLVATLTASGAVLGLTGTAAAQDPPPQTGFEQSNGASWTTHQQELDFLAAVDQASDRVEIEVIGQTLQNRPLHLVKVGHPTPRDVQGAQGEPTVLFVCSQHGNEPAGREACLKALRDLAFTTDATLIDELSRMTFLFVPTANPDGRNANSRGNSQGVDVNRDHLGLATREARAMAAVVRDWKPDLSIDLHEYGPGTPAVYDDDVLYLWPRNLNVERSIHDLAKDYVLGHVEPCVEAAGFTADEYGQDAAGDVNVRQTAGDHDEGIMRNAMGLRHSLGILFETAVSMSTNPGQLPSEAGSAAGTNRRRVTSHRTIIDCTLTYLRAKGTQVMQATATAPLRLEGEGQAQNVPLYLGGADNQAPTAAQTIYPPPCYYRLTPAQATTAATAMELHGIQAVMRDGEIHVPVGQAAEPVIPLLLDGRGSRDIVQGTAVGGTPLDKACRLPKPWDDPAPAAGSALAVGGLALVLAIRRRRMRG
jgi:hypothetical protein